MSEYLQLGHMRLIKEREREGGYYIPHHAVIKTSSTTTKLRVVFNASCPTSTNKSLNDIMHVGPQLQNDITEILLRWRTHKIVFAADIEKMYGQINIKEQEQQYQKILWRFQPQASIKEYCLKTVTYGTAAAPYLATRTLHQLAEDEEKDFPETAKIIREDFYADDVLSGADSIEAALKLQQELITIMHRGGFNLRKWSTNNPQLINSLPEDMVDQTIYEVGIAETKKTLGIIWDPQEDQFLFKINVQPLAKVTKRTILSETSKIFDALGWLAPVIIQAKLHVQELWTEKIDWDQQLSTEHIRKWENFYNELPEIESVRIKRWMNKSRKIELHGFCDASEKAYGAVVYSKCEYNGKIHITLLQAKSKVAPIKLKVTLSRLELCSAQLLSKLLIKIKASLMVDNESIYAWSDSMITLAWIKNPSHKWETFVANRVSEINRNLPGDRWQHVRTHENPADHITRGINPGKIQYNDLWWFGPAWLKNEKSTWPSQPASQPSTPAVRQVHATTVKRFEFIERFSKLQRMLRVLAFCRRFKTKTQGPITFGKMEEILTVLIKKVQQSEFSEEIKAATLGQSIGKGSLIRTLSPVMDKEGMLSVGGRLHNSDLSYRQQHPLLLPSKHHLSKLIIVHAHESTLHGGIEATLAFLRRKFWIPKAKDTIRATIRNCVKCIRYKASTAEQIMGQLPKPRVTQSRLSRTRV